MEHTASDFLGEKPVLNFLGEKVALGPLQKSMIPTMHRWNNDFAVASLSGDPLRPTIQEEMEKEFEQRLKSRDRSSAIFAIYEQVGMQFIGLAALTSIDYQHRTAWYMITIGEKSCWGKGYGAQECPDTEIACSGDPGEHHRNMLRQDRHTNQGRNDRTENIQRRQ